MSWAFRNALRRFKVLEFPFLCYRVSPGGIHRPDSTWPQNWAITHGKFIKEIGDRVKVIPYFADYESVAWSHKYSNSLSLFQHFYENNFDDYRFEYDYIINGKTYTWTGSLEFTNLELDPEFNESDELQRAKLHSVDLSFQVKAFIFEGQGVQLADGAVVEMFYNGEIDDSPDREWTVTGQTGTGTG